MAQNPEDIQIKIDTIVEGAKSVSDIKKAIKDLRTEALLAGESNKDAFNAATKAAAGLEDKLDDVNDSMKSLKGGGIEPLASSFGLMAEGLLKLDFGKAKVGAEGLAESIKGFSITKIKEEFVDFGKSFGKIFTEIGKKLKSQFIKTVDGAKQSLSGLSTAFKGITSGDFTKSIDGIGQSFKGLGNIIKANALFLLATAVLYIIQNFDELSNSGGILGTYLKLVGEYVQFIIDKFTMLTDAIGLTDSKASKAAKNAKTARDQAREDYLEGISLAAKESTELELLYSRSQNLNLSLKERNKAIDQLKETYPDTFSNLSNEIILTGQATGAYKLLNEQIYNRAKASVYAKKMETLIGQEIDLEDKIKKSKLVSPLLTAGLISELNSVKGLIKSFSDEIIKFTPTTTTKIEPLKGVKEKTKKEVLETKFILEDFLKDTSDTFDEIKTLTGTVTSNWGGSLLKQYKNIQKEFKENPFTTFIENYESSIKTIDGITQLVKNELKSATDSGNKELEKSIQAELDKLIDLKDTYKNFNEKRKIQLEERRVLEGLEQNMLASKTLGLAKEVLDTELILLKKQEDIAIAAARQKGESVLAIQKFYAEKRGELNANYENGIQKKVQSNLDNDANISNSKVNRNRSKKNLSKAIEDGFDADLNALRTKSILEQAENDGFNKISVKEKYDKLEIELEKRKQADLQTISREKARENIQFMTDAAGAINNLVEGVFAFRISKLQKGSDAEKRAAKQQFKISKALQLATATTTGVMSVMSAYENGMKNPIPLAGTATAAAYAVIAGISAAGNIAKIAATQFNPDSSSGSGISSSLGNLGGSAMDINNKSSSISAPNLIGLGNASSNDGRDSFQKVYVSEADIRGVGRKVDVLESASYFNKP